MSQSINSSGDDPNKSNWTVRVISIDEYRLLLREQVMALPDEHHYGPVGNNRCIKRADVLKLLDGK